MTDYPYMLSNNKISQIITKIQQAARPQKFTLEFLRSIGFTSTNDRAFIPLAKKLGFLMEDGVPTSLYDQLKDTTCSSTILATQIKKLYSELFAINTEIQKSSEADVKGAISRVTGKDADGVSRIYNTFKTLCGIADFSTITTTEQETSIEESIEPENNSAQVLNGSMLNPQFHYNIQIHLPATNDISVYNAIFKSLKDNLMI